MPLTVSTILAMLIAVIGLLIYVLASNPKVIEIGRIMVFCGLLVTLFLVGGARITIGR